MIPFSVAAIKIDTIMIISSDTSIQTVRSRARLPINTRKKVMKAKLPVDLCFHI
jgi:hypothetical protein